MAGENLNQKINNSLLNNVQGLPDPTINAGDFNFTPEGLSPEQQQAYQQQNNPATGALNPTDYYPDLHHQIAVGNYGGSEVGNLTLFAPGGGLVPLGLMDARDMAIHHAALQKAKAADDWNKKYNAPVTKHVAVQQQLTDDYFGGLHQWEDNALKQANGDQQLAHQILSNSPGFNKWNQSMQDTAKYHNAIVEQSAQLTAMEKDPNMVLSPEVRKMNQDVISGVAYQGQNPFSPAGHDIGAKFLGLQAAADLDVKTNQVLDKAIPDIEQLPPTYVRRGKNEVATYLEKEYFPPDRVKDMAHNLYKAQYEGTGFTEDDVYKSLKDKIGEKIKRKTDTYDKWFKPAENGDDDYSNATPQVTSNFNFTKDGQTQSAYMENAFNTGVKDQTKVLNFKISDKIKDVQGNNIQNKTGNISGNVQQIGSFPYDNLKKEFITPEQYAEMKKNGTATSHNIDWKAGALVNEVPTTEQKNTPDFVPNTYVVPVSELKGKLKGFDKPIEHVEQFTEQKNAERKTVASKQQQSSSPKEGEERQFKEGVGVFKNGKWQLKK